MSLLKEGKRLDAIDILPIEYPSGGRIDNDDANIAGRAAGYDSSQGQRIGGLAGIQKIKTSGCRVRIDRGVVPDEYMFTSDSDGIRRRARSQDRASEGS